MKNSIIKDVEKTLETEQRIAKICGKINLEILDSCDLSEKDRRQVFKIKDKIVNITKEMRKSQKKLDELSKVFSNIMKGFNRLQQKLEWHLNNLPAALLNKIYEELE